MTIIKRNQRVMYGMLLAAVGMAFLSVWMAISSSHPARADSHYNHQHHRLNHPQQKQQLLHQLNTNDMMDEITQDDDNDAEERKVNSARLFDKLDDIDRQDLLEDQQGDDEDEYVDDTKYGNDKKAKGDGNDEISTKKAPSKISSSSNTQQRKSRYHGTNHKNDTGMAIANPPYSKKLVVTTMADATSSEKMMLVASGNDQQAELIPPSNQHNHPSSSSVSYFHNYTQLDMIRLAAARSKFLLHLLVFDGSRRQVHDGMSSSFQLFAIANRPIKRPFCTCDSHLVELLIDGLVTSRPERFDIKSHQDKYGQRQPPQPPSNSFQVLLATVHDNVHFPCVDAAEQQLQQRQQGMTCIEQQYPPLLTFGSSTKHSLEAPFIQLFPTVWFQDCLYHWRMEQRTQQSPNDQRKQQKQQTGKQSKSYCRLQAMIHRIKKHATSVASFQNNNKIHKPKYPNKTRVMKLSWDDLIPQIYWRGSNLNFLHDLPRYRHLISCQKALLPLAMSLETSQRQLPHQPNKLQSTLASTSIRKQVGMTLLQQRDKLMPRCLAVAMTLQVEAEAASTHSNKSAETTNQALPWIDVKFIDPPRMSQQKNSSTISNKNIPTIQRLLDMLYGNFTSPTQMAQYKYQIDLGGMGGTTWLGTITKLAMPGLLFHHETPTKDWFYDDLRPWVHYVPIHTNLSNLYDMYVWAETHPRQAQQIARRGTQYAIEHVSHSSLARTFQEHFVQRMGIIADAYQPLINSETMESMVDTYRKHGLHVTQLTYWCNAIRCKWKMSPPRPT